jgi:hypothetical protein
MEETPPIPANSPQYDPWHVLKPTFLSPLNTPDQPATIKNYLSITKRVYASNCLSAAFTLRVKKMKYSLRECEGNQWSKSETKERKEEIPVVGYCSKMMMNGREFSSNFVPQLREGLLNSFLFRSVQSQTSKLLRKPFSDYW